MIIKTERIEARVNPAIKALVEKASSAIGMSVTDYLVSLITADAPKKIQLLKDITLSNEEFNRFLKLCESDTPLSPEIIKASKLLDNEGF